MAITVVSSSTATKSTTSNTLTVDAPASVQDGDILVFSAAVGTGGTVASGDTISSPGWTAFPGGGIFNAFEVILLFRMYKVASSEPSSYLFTISNGHVGFWAACIVAYRGASTSTPLDVTDSPKNNDSVSLNLPINSINTVTDGCLLIPACAGRPQSGTITEPSGYTEDAEAAPSSTSLRVETSHLLQSSAGPTGAINATYTSAIGRRSLTDAAALRPGTQSASFTASGGAVAGGSASQKADVVFAASGGGVAGGGGEQLQSALFVGSGGAVGGGAADFISLRTLPLLFTLTYEDADGNDQTAPFRVYGVRWADVVFESFLYRDASGEYWERPVGYRFLIEVMFFPLLHDLTRLNFLYAFFLGQNRRLTFQAETREVAFQGDVVEALYEDMAFFSDAFTLTFVERQLRYVSDDNSTRVLKPLYQDWNDAAVGSYFINWIDEDTVQLKKTDLEIVGGNRQDPTWAYQHVWDIDFGVIRDPAKRTWLMEFCLWKSKQLDLRDINPTWYDTPVDVVFAGGELKFRWEDGVGEALAARLTFVEKKPRRIAQEPIAVPWLLEFDFRRRTN
jgi:hypothetical protein